MIHKEGRKPYDPNVPREPLYEPVREAPEGYKSIQQVINTGPGKTINQARLDFYTKKKGFKKINVFQIYSIAIGSKIAYVTRDNKWRSGGFLVSIKNSNTLYGTKEKLDTYKIYIEYKGFNGALFTAQEDDIRELYVLPKKQKKNTGKILLPALGEPTRFPIYAQNDSGDDVIIKYARDEYERDRFIGTLKYRNIISRGFYFEDDNDADEYDSDIYTVMSDIDEEE